MMWKQPLTHKQIRMMCRQNLAKMGVKTGNCPKGYEEFDCKCYKVFIIIIVYYFARNMSVFVYSFVLCMYRRVNRVATFEIFPTITALPSL